MTRRFFKWVADQAGDLIWTHTPCCHEMTRLLSREYEKPLPLLLRFRMAVHLLCCKWCTRYRKQLGLMHALMKPLARHECEHGEMKLSEEAKTRIRALLTADP